MSTRKIEVTRGLSVNLTWYFSKSACFIQEQEFGYSSGDRLAILAVKRQNESIQVAEEMPEQFKGRIAAVASSSTLIIHNVQFNDSIYQFASVIKARSFVVPQFISKTLLPRYILSVTDAPSITLPPKEEVTIGEGEILRIVAIAEARPAPFAKFRLSTQGTSVIVQPNLIHSFLYEASFVLKSVSSHLCGSRLTTEFQNSKGNSGIRNTDIKINLHLNNSFGLATSFINSTCIYINWNRKPSGTCQVKYVVKLYDGLKHLAYSNTGYNIGSYVYCSSRLHQIERVTLTVSYQGLHVSSSKLITGQPIFTATKTAQRHSTPASSPNTANVSSRSSRKTFSRTIATTKTNHVSTDPWTAGNVLTTSKGDSTSYGSTDISTELRPSRGALVAAVASLGCTVFVLVFAVVALLKWNMQLRSLKLLDISNSKADGGDLAHNGSIDLNELTERPVCGTMTNSKPTTEVSNENMYADWASVDKKASKNPTEKNS